MAGSGREALFEVLATEGVSHLFGNPGTTELPLIDGLASRPELSYVLALQEATAVGMADGYAQVTGRPAFLNLHTSAGLGNAVGNLTNAQANGTPLVVTAGQQDRRHLVADPMLSGDLVGLARPVSKWAHEVRTVAELGTVLRRAFADAATPPRGPVFVSIPMDVLEEVGEAPVPPPSPRRISSVPDPATLAELADLIVEHGPDATVIVAGDEVAHSGAVPALVALAEAAGVGVRSSPLAGSTVFPPTHHLFAGPLPPSAAGIRKALGGHRRVVLVGGRAFMVYPWSPGEPLPDGTDLVHLADDPAQLGRTHPTLLGAAGDPRATLEALAPLVAARVRTDVVAAAADRRRRDRATEIDRLEASASGRYGDLPMHPAAAAHSLLRSLPDDVFVVDEAITTGSYVRGYHHPRTPGRYFFCRGGGLGWGMPAACGVALGSGRQPVLCVVGDGSAMYSPQALWTAARERLPVIFAVVNNRQYLILKRALAGMDGDTVRHGRHVAMDLVDPAVDYLALAESMGVPSTLVEKAGDVGDAVRAAVDAGGPHLLELPISTP